eukprot:TRINITY_DN23353_c0_g1_i1.p1 TRINITY_DN23353_c0_g1~~TRINITY_DN23353_c0_g1_i1.p1  ORF type:complete len:331 (+),score=70.92 TRINITY_DN23353_c0_g1_i1:41-1033(+)
MLRRTCTVLGYHAKLAANVSDVIGGTPLVALDRLTAGEGVDGRIVAKLDMLNPGFSKKDKAALEIIKNAEETGELVKGMPVVELTSGNMGTGLAIVCRNRGYRFIAVMSKGNSEERRRMMRALGAEVVVVDQLPESIPGQVSGGDLELVEAEAVRLTNDLKAFRADQFNREGNLRAHYATTGPEFWDQTDGVIHGFCDFVGSAGTYAGVTKYLKEKDPTIACYVIEPEGAAALKGEPITNPGHPIQGGGYIIPYLTFLSDTPIDGYLTVSGHQARHFTRQLALQEGIFAGFSSGANVAGALQLLKGPLQGKTIGVMICDSGLKYLSTDLW